MQEMAISNGGILYDINNHQGNNLHEITIDKNSNLYKIIGSNKTMVNSRHKSAVKNTDLTISSISSDGIIESIEDSNSTFFIGLEWHPENLYDSDINSRKIFDNFIKLCHY